MISSMSFSMRTSRPSLSSCWTSSRPSPFLYAPVWTMPPARIVPHRPEILLAMSQLAWLISRHCRTGHNRHPHSMLSPWGCSPLAGRGPCCSRWRSGWCRPRPWRTPPRGSPRPGGAPRSSRACSSPPWRIPSSPGCWCSSRLLWWSRLQQVSPEYSKRFLLYV